MWRLTNPIANQLQPDIQIKDWETPTVLQQNQLFHCLATQASSDEGRPPPRSSDVDDDTWHRWEENNRQFPPWQYRQEYLTRHKDGQWQTVTPLQRERMRGFRTTIPTHHQWMTGPEIACLATLGMSQQQFGYSSSSYCPPTHKQSQYQCSSPQHTMPQFDWQQHLSWTLTHYENGHQPKPIDPTLHWAIRHQRSIPNIQQVRQDIIHEIQTLTTEWDDVTQQWFQTLPDHCKSAYQQPHMIKQIPVLHHLLTTIQYPHADILLQELTTGFSLIGQLQPGLNWKVRTDNKYTETQTRTELHTYNQHTF